MRFSPFINKLPYLILFSTTLSLFSDLLVPPRYHLNTSSIQALLLRFLGSARYLSIDSPIHQAYFLGVFVYSIAS